MRLEPYAASMPSRARHKGLRCGLSCAGYRGAVPKNSGNEVVRGIEALLRHEMYFYAEAQESNP
jgi:hypothetical protein